jgi:DNA-binding transcriptional MerR regulator
VRYYIQRGLVDRPAGETRAARYGERHLAQLLGIRKWQQAGLSLERIAELLADASAKGPPPRRRGAGTVEVWSHLVIDEGVELTINPAAAGFSPAQVRRLFREVTAAYSTIRKERKT